MSGKNFEKQLAELESLKENGDSAFVLKGVRKALGNSNNYIASKAAQTAGQKALDTLIPDLLAAADRFFTNPDKTDPQCWAKNAIIQALADLGHTDPGIFIRGLRHVQMEPVWGGQVDTAGTLRGKCAQALVACRQLSDFEVLSYLIEVLVDVDKTVRVEAARAIGQLRGPEAILLLRLRALTGDSEPEVLGACFSAILSNEAEAGIAFVLRFLEAGGEAGIEAALALGSTRSPRAFSALKERRNRRCDPDLAEVLPTAIALTRLPEAIEFLLELIETEASTSAIEALASARLSEDVRSRAEKIVERSKNPRLLASFERHFKS